MIEYITPRQIATESSTMPKSVMNTIVGGYFWLLSCADKCVIEHDRRQTTANKKKRTRLRATYATFIYTLLRHQPATSGSELRTCGQNTTDAQQTLLDSSKEGILLPRERQLKLPHTTFQHGRNRIQRLASIIPLFHPPRERRMRCPILTAFLKNIWICSIRKPSPTLEPSCPMVVPKSRLYGS